MSDRPGDWRVICDYSGFKCWASECAKTWDGFYVMRRFVGEETKRHPQDLVRGKPDDQAVPWSRPETEDTFISTPVTPSDL